MLMLHARMCTSRLIVQLKVQRRTGLCCPACTQSAVDAAAEVVLMFPIQVLEDVSEEHARKTITLDPHPHLAINAASIHPCRQGVQDTTSNSCRMLCGSASDNVVLSL